MALFELESEYGPAGDQPRAIEELTQAIREQKTPLTLKGVTGSGKTFTLAHVINNVQLPALVISHNKTLAGQLYQEFKDLFPRNAVEYYISYYDYYQPEAYIASKDLFIEKEFSINDQIDRHRSSTISSLLERKDVIVIATVSCLFKMSNPSMFNALRIQLTKGQSYNRKVLINCLVNQHYFRTEDALMRSSFRVRGDSIELWPASMRVAYRVEFEWEQVGKIWKMDTDTFERIAEVDTLVIYPAGNFFVARDKIKRALQSIKGELQQRVRELRAQGKTLEARRLQEKTEYDMELIKNTGSCMGIENYSYHLSLDDPGASQAVLMDFFPKDFITIIDESHITLPQVKSMHKGNASRKAKLIEHGFRLPSILKNKPLSLNEFEEKLDFAVYNSATPDAYELGKSRVVAEQLIRPTGLLNPIIEVKPMDNYLPALEKEMQACIARKERVLITTISKRNAEQMTQDLLGRRYKACYLHSEVETMERLSMIKDLRAGTIEVLVGINILREGLDLPEVSFLAILDADKHGFLRSAVSLTQIIGRASRNINGKVIMFANTITPAMTSAIAENDRVRRIQQDFNQVNNIKPQTIRKRLVEAKTAKEQELEKVKNLELQVIKSNYNLEDDSSRALLIKELEALMQQHAENMDFYEATLIKKELASLNGH